MSDVKTVTILLGNTDNKLSQSEWAHYIHAVKDAINFGYETHFSGGSEFDAPWQNACFVVIFDSDMIDTLRRRLADVRKTFRQDSIAITVSDTEFI